MQRSTLRRRLIQVAAVSSLAAIALALTPGFELHAGPLRVSVHSPRHLLMLAVVSAIAAWAVSLAQGDDEGPPGPRRWGRFAALSGLVALTALVYAAHAISAAAPDAGEAVERIKLAAFIQFGAAAAGLAIANRAVTKEDLICITGSFYLVGEAKKYFAAKQAAAEAAKAAAQQE